MWRGEGGPILQYEISPCLLFSFLFLSFSIFCGWMPQFEDKAIQLLRNTEPTTLTPTLMLSKPFKSFFCPCNTTISISIHIYIFHSHLPIYKASYTYINSEKQSRVPNHMGPTLGSLSLNLLPNYKKLHTPTLHCYTISLSLHLSFLFSLTYVNARWVYFWY